MDEPFQGGTQQAEPGSEHCHQQIALQIGAIQPQFKSRDQLPGSVVIEVNQHGQPVDVPEPGHLEQGGDPALAAEHHCHQQGDGEQGTVHEMRTEAGEDPHQEQIDAEQHLDEGQPGAVLSVSEMLPDPLCQCPGGSPGANAAEGTKHAAAEGTDTVVLIEVVIVHLEKKAVQHQRRRGAEYMQEKVRLFAEEVVQGQHHQQHGGDVPGHAVDADLPHPGHLYQKQLRYAAQDQLPQRGQGGYILVGVQLNAKPDYKVEGKGNEVDPGDAAEFVHHKADGGFSRLLGLLRPVAHEAVRHQHAGDDEEEMHPEPAPLVGDLPGKTAGRCQQSGVVQENTQGKKEFQHIQLIVAFGFHITPRF